jgi:hypothetical protein
MVAGSDPQSLPTSTPASTSAGPTDLAYDARVANPRRAANTEGLAALVNETLGGGTGTSLYDIARSFAS